MKSLSSHTAGATTSFERMAAGKRALIGLREPLLCCSPIRRGTEVNQKREEWEGSSLKTKEHEQGHYWIGVAHVALALRYVLAF